MLIYNVLLFIIVCFMKLSLLNIIYYVDLIIFIIMFFLLIIEFFLKFLNFINDIFFFLNLLCFFKKKFVCNYSYLK